MASDPFEGMDPYVKAILELAGYDGSRKVTTTELFGAIEQFASDPANTAVAGSTVTALYSGNIGGFHTYKVANDLAERSIDSNGAPSGKIRIIDKTRGYIYW